MTRIIYLQEKDDPEYDEYNGQLWCEDNVFEKSTKFIEMQPTAVNLGKDDENTRNKCIRNV